MSGTLRQGPALRMVGSCEGCAWLRSLRTIILPGKPARAVSACVHPSRADGGTIFDKARRDPQTPEWCPLAPRARLALLVEMAHTTCRQCGRDVEPERQCYAIPTCFVCLPPPPPLPVVEMRKWTDESDRDPDPPESGQEIT